MVCRNSVLALLFVFTALAVSCSGGGPPAPSPSATTGASPTATTALSPSPTAPASPVGAARPAILEDAEVVALKQGPEGQIPGNLALIIETGCWQCDGPTEGLTRVYSRPDGSAVADTLLDPESFGTRVVTTPKGVEQDSPYITGFAASEDGSEIVVSLCVKESCGSGGMDGWSPGSKTLLLRSTDGGITWDQWGAVGVGGFVISLAGPGRVVVGVWEAANQPPQFAYFPGLAPLPAPSLGAWPIHVLDGEVIWRAGDARLLRSDGSIIIDFGPDAGVYRVATAASVTGARLGVTWYWKDHIYFSFLDSGGRLVTTYETPSFALPAVDLGKGLLIGNAGVDVSRLSEPLPSGVFDYLPASFHLSEGVVSPMVEPFAGPDVPRGRNHVVAAQHGPFVRVATGASCLNVRARPDPAARPLACAADGVLLRDTGLLVEGYGGESWLRVVTPAGVEGWASTAFLER